MFLLETGVAAGEICTIKLKTNKEDTQNRKTKTQPLAELCSPFSALSRYLSLLVLIIACQIARKLKEALTFNGEQSVDWQMSAEATDRLAINLWASANLDKATTHYGTCFDITERQTLGSHAHYTADYHPTQSHCREPTRSVQMATCGPH